MRKRPTIKKHCAGILAVAMAFIVGIGTTPIPAKAGLETGVTYADSFDLGALDGTWVCDNAFVEADAGQSKGLRFVNASEGAGIVTQQEISASKIRMEIEVESMNLASGGWMGFLLGTKDAPTIMNWNNLADGKHILLSYINGEWYLNTQTKNEDGTYVGYNLVDAEGNEIKNGTDSESRHFYKVAALPSNGGVISNTTLILCLDDQGNFSFSMRKFGATQEVLLAQTKGVKLPPYSAGRLGVCVMQGNSGINGKLTNVKTFADGSSHATTEFRFDKEDVGVDYLLDYSKNTSSMSFNATGKLKLTAAEKKRAYAINKSPVYVDENVVNYEMADNISIRQELSFVDFKNQDVFSVYFGMSNYYDTEIGAKGSYALKIRRESGQNVFSVVEYTADNAASEKAIIPETAFGYENGSVPIAILFNGDGSLKVTVGNQTKQVQKQLTFQKRKIFFGYGLVGNGTVKIDNLTLGNALYSKPENKDLAADFTDNDININEWYLPEWGGNLEERYDGVYADNGELVFKNVNSNAGITTKAQFSNFDLTFDITDIQREEKNGIMPSSDIRIMYGIAGYNTGFNILYYQELRPMITFRSSDNGTAFSILHVANEIAGTLPERYDMFSAAAKGEIFTVKITMTDGLLNVYLKTSKESDFTKVAETHAGTCLTGSIRISGYGDGVAGDGACSNFCIDNLFVKNTDKDPNNKTDYGYTSNRDWIKWDGYEYVDTWNSADLIPIEPQTEFTIHTMQIVILAGGIAILALAVGVSIFVIRRKRKCAQKKECKE